MSERFLRLPEVIETVGLRRTAIYDKITRGEFPAPVKIGSVSVWLASEISAYIGVHPSPRLEIYARPARTSCLLWTATASRVIAGCCAIVGGLDRTVRG